MDIVRKPPEIAVKTLLDAAQLPIADITPEHMEHFFGAWEGSSLAGVVGIEPFGTTALLRSLTVAELKRCSGLGAALLAQAEEYAMGQGIRSMFLLTTTAEPYFEKHGYSYIVREEVPAAIQNTVEFTSLCPGSAVLMVKHMPAIPPTPYSGRVQSPFSG